MATIEGIMKVLEEDVYLLWKFHSELHKLENPSLEEHLLLLQLNDLYLLLHV